MFRAQAGRFDMAQQHASVAPGGRRDGFAIWRDVVGLRAFKAKAGFGEAVVPGLVYSGPVQK